MRRSELITTLLASLIACLTAWPAAADLEVTAIGRDLENLTRTEEVRHFSFFEGDEVDLLEVGQMVAIGDELTALADDLFVELACPAGTLLRFTGKFRVAINSPGEGQDCRIDNRDGKLDLLSEQPTESCVAGVCLATGGTRYASRLERGASGLERQVLVFEGSVDVAYGAPEPASISSGERLDLRPGVQGAAGQLAASRRRVSAAEIDSWSDLYARFDVVKARTAGTVELTGEQLQPLREEFKQLHAKVLENPDESAPRAELAERQVTYHLNREALYNAKRSGLVNPGQLQELQIDPQRLQQGDPGDRQRFETLIRQEREVIVGSLTPQLTPQVGVIQPPSTVAVLRPAAELNAMSIAPPAGATDAVKTEFWTAQIAVQVQKRIDRQYDSRAALIKARAHEALARLARDRETAVNEATTAGRDAKIALRLHRDDGLLDEAELALCERLIRAGRG